ncbi:MAG: hypothetical protein IPL59_17060, partial [Candidatus Competibacteraceae bacterium]|nr:hypothetical protein [Candidatus Competibacteraceae bacterium]
ISDDAFREKPQTKNRESVQPNRHGDDARVLSFGRTSATTSRPSTPVSQPVNTRRVEEAQIQAGGLEHGLSQGIRVCISAADFCGSSVVLLDGVMYARREPIAICRSRRRTGKAGQLTADDQLRGDSAR